MASEFRYDPAEGPLSGPEFISQTEIAINELGDHIETVEDKADSAGQAAENAQGAANEALTTANQALSDAADAMELAGEAQGGASQASGKADEAQERADAAYNLAATADTDATQALTDAAGAMEAAEAAQDTADEAFEKAGTGLSQAIAAYHVGMNALGEYVTVTADFDADMQYYLPGKYYLTGTGTLSGTPIERPCFFSSGVDKGLNVTIQWCHDDTGRPVYVRTGQITPAVPGEGEAPGTEMSVTWGGWAELTPSEGALKAYIDAQIAEKILNTLKYQGQFIGFYEDAPEGDGDEGAVQLKTDGTEKAVMTDGAWVTSPYAHELFDLWGNKTDGHGYYWFNDEWNILDFNEDLSAFFEKADVLDSWPEEPGQLTNAKVPGALLVKNALDALSGVDLSGFATAEALQAQDYVLLPLNFDTDQSEDPIRVSWPAGFSWAQLTFTQTDGSAVTLTAANAYNASSTGTLTSSKVQFTALAGTAVKFTAAITGGTTADFMLKFTKV